MSLMLPDWLEWVLEMLGYDWPTGDEDKMNESADRWREFANVVEQLQSEGVSAAGNVLSANSGDSIDGFSTTWEKFSGNGSGYLDDARTAAELIAFALNAGSGVIIGMKVAVIAQLAILAAEIIAAQAAAPFTLGLSEIGAAGATQATRLIVRRILKEAREALVEAIVETVKEPAVSALEAMISDAIAQGMNMNFGAQQGFDVGRSAKTGAEAGVEALKNSGQTFAESLRDGAGGRAGHHARGGLESAAGHGGGEDGGGSSGGGSDGGGSESASGSGSGSGTGSGSGSGGGSSTGNGSGSGGDSNSGSDSSTGSGSGSDSSSGSGSGSDGSSGGSGTGAGNSAGGGNGSGGTSHSPRPGDTPTDTASGTGAATHPAASSDGSPSGQDGDRGTPQAQPLPPPDQRSPFDAGYQGGSDSPYGSSPTPDPDTSHPSPDSVSTQPTPDHTPDSARPGPDSVSTQPAPDHTPDAARPDHPDQVSTQPTPDNTPDAARPGPDPVSTQPAPDHTPDAARPHPDTLSTQPAPGPSPHPDAAPTPDAGPGPNHPSPPTPDQPSPGPSNSPSPDAPSHPDAGPAPSQQPTASPDPGAGTPPSHGGTSTDTNSSGDGNTNSNSNSNNGDNTGSGRGATPHVNVPSQGAPAQHAPSSGPPLGQRDPSPGDPMPTVDDNDDTTVRTQSADTMAAPAQRTADPGTTAPTTPQQSPQHTPQAAGPMMAPPTTVPQQGGPATPNTAPPRGTTPPGGNPPTPANRRPDGSQAVRDVTQQPSPERPAYNPRLDGPRPDSARPRADDPRNPGNGRPDPRQQRPTDPNQQQPQPQPQPQNNRPDPRQQHPTGEDPTPNAPSGNPPSHNTPPNGRPENDRPENNHPENDRPGNEGPQNNRPDQPADHAPPADQPDRSDQHAPAPASETRNRERPGGLDGPTDEHQQHVENSIPRDENGEPQRHPDPDHGNWLTSLNDPGPDTPGRNNNCVDAALAAADTYSGNPTAAAHRTPDTHPDGTPSDRGENNGRDRIENTLGTRFHDYGNGNDAFHRLENDLRNTGHGSQAVIVTQDRNGRAHAWNVVNHHGKITYLDAQTGQRSNTPLHDGTNGVHAIPLDPNRHPLPTNPTNNNHDTDGDRRPAAEPAGAGEKRTHPGEARDIERDDQRHPVHGERPDTHQDGLPPDDAQDRLRANEQTPVHQIQHDVLDQQMRQWANDGSLARVLQIAAGHGPDPDGPRRLNSGQLAQHLEGFHDLNRGERMAVVASLGRLSHTFHKEYGVHSNPVSDGKESVGASLHQRNVDRNLSGLLKGVDPQGPHAASHGPDLTGRNFAVIEIEGPNGTEYVVDSSHPKEGDTKKMHSEENLGNWLKEANKVSGDKYTLFALYTEREPCGNKKGALGKHNCSDYLIKMAKEQGKGHDVPVYYSTSYRTDAEVVQERSKARQELMKQARDALGVRKLPRETLKQIDEAVHQRVPDSPAMVAQERQFEDRVDRVRNVWATIATQV
ncbi:toxin glutamine deamidase domain-containing protein [Streptomyces decoyicus]|uniref:toxin glutamine deamidase domain-containing protein n=1 Tax=Streptomyces decoyicus TaxID=249567 RepID=UPI00386836BA